MPQETTAITPFSDRIVYLDESGDHSLEVIDPQFPIFVLSACVFRKEDYRTTVVPAFLDLKFRFFGHDMVVLHSRDVRKATDPFAVLQNAALRTDFLASVNAAVALSPFTLIATIIDKRHLAGRHGKPDNPYEIALTSFMERVFRHLRGLGQHEATTPFVFECRGKREDADPELAFRRATDGATSWAATCPSASSSPIRRPTRPACRSPTSSRTPWDVTTSFRSSRTRRTTPWRRSSGGGRQEIWTGGG